MGIGVHSGWCCQHKLFGYDLGARLDLRFKRRLLGSIPADLPKAREGPKARLNSFELTIPISDLGRMSPLGGELTARGVAP